jgi:RND family efflux transporter MFP subunit
MRQSIAARRIPVLQIMDSGRFWIALVALFVAVSALASGNTLDLRTALAEYREIPREYRLDGIVEAVQRTTVSAQTQGVVMEILADVDDFVEQGSLVVRLKDVEQQAAVSRAEASLEEARARLVEARDEYERVKELGDRKLVSQSKIDAASAALKAARARRDSAQAELARAREQLDYTLIRAPYSGIVTERHVELGETVQPGRPVMSGISLERLRVNVDVPQSLVSSIREQGKARIFLPEGQGAVDAAGVTIFPFADQATNTFKVRLDLPGNVPGLFPGMFLKTAFVIGSRRQLLIPQSAVAYRSEVTGAYVIGDDGGLHFRYIRTGQPVNGDKVVVLAGLEAGERVAVDPVAAGLALKNQRKTQRSQ